jgi:hypothetical protein
MRCAHGEQQGDCDDDGSHGDCSLRAPSGSKPDDLGKFVTQEGSPPAGSELVDTKTPEMVTGRWRWFLGALAEH